ncbi:TetR family transcriptional regulator C-terminal domain-containing protein [Pantoea sp. Marseille-Q5743]|uniref:YobI family P-loop NTPase n=1 Tax=Pantoea TaxID=53335 RepID=UPI00396793D4
MADFQFQEREDEPPVNAEVELSIVQQILYKENKDNLPDSRVDRIQSRDVKHILTLFLTSVTILLAVFLLTLSVFPKNVLSSPVSGSREYYEQVYWQATWARLKEAQEITEAIDTFFSEAADILLSPSAPCGCMVVLAAINVFAESADVDRAARLLRQEDKDLFEKRLTKAVQQQQLPAETDTAALATVLNTLLEGMSIEAKEGATPESLKMIGQHAVRLLQPLSHRSHKVQQALLDDRSVFK